MHEQREAAGAPPPSPAWRQAVEAALRGAIMPLRVLSLDVLLAPADGAARVPLPGGRDPVVAITCELTSVSFGSGNATAPPPAGEQQQQPSQQGVATAGGGGGAPAAAARVRGGRRAQAAPGGGAGDGTAGDPLRLDEEEEEGGAAGSSSDSNDSDEEAIEDAEEEDDDSGGGGGGARLLSAAGPKPAAKVPPRGAAAGGDEGVERVMFALAGPEHGQAQAHGRAGAGALAPGAEVRVPVGDAGGVVRVRAFGSERELLGAFRDWLLAADPDAVATFQVR